MKKKILSLMLFVALSSGFVVVTHSAVPTDRKFDPCHNSEGKFEPTRKDCDPYSCGCLFHRIEEFFADIFTKYR